jgi:antitoxin CcdA
MGEEVDKRAVSVLVEAQLLDEANRLHIDLSETLERGLRSMVQSDEERRWVEENKQAFEEYNASVAQHGVLADDLGIL